MDSALQPLASFPSHTVKFSPRVTPQTKSADHQQYTNRNGDPSECSTDPAPRGNRGAWAALNIGVCMLVWAHFSHCFCHAPLLQLCSHSGSAVARAHPVSVGSVLLTICHPVPSLFGSLASTAQDQFITGRIFWG